MFCFIEIDIIFSQEDFGFDAQFATKNSNVAIGRAILRDPSVFLFDEPLSNLDAALRMSTRQEIATLHKQIDTTPATRADSDIHGLQVRAFRTYGAREGRHPVFHGGEPG